QRVSRYGYNVHNSTHQFSRPSAGLASGHKLAGVDDPRPAARLAAGLLFTANLQRLLGARGCKANKAESAVIAVIGVNRARQFPPCATFGTKGAPFGRLCPSRPFSAIELDPPSMNDERLQRDAFSAGLGIAPGTALGGTEG